MKAIFRFVLSFLICFNFYGQKDLVVVSSTTYDIVYRNVPNLIRIGFLGMDSNYSVECLGCDITNIDSLGYRLPANNFIITPGESMEVFIRLYDDSLSQNFFYEHRFINKNLPSPELFFGAAAPGNFVSPMETKLFAVYPSEFFLDFRFKILRWKADVNGKSYNGVGNTLSQEFQGALKEMKSEQEFSVSVLVIGEDNEERTIKSIFKIAPEDLYENNNDELKH
jgi:hypothetical protein